MTNATTIKAGDMFKLQTRQRRADAHILGWSSWRDLPATLLHGARHKPYYRACLEEWAADCNASRVIMSQRPELEIECQVVEAKAVQA